ncbi:MAG: SGNH/GDSL hydrolase family protein [Alphaproteobacteria bacterium]|nr:MAG: SGNH/GDSL hydrolase family protein [Alphaproteobacteria bacterium]
MANRSARAANGWLRAVATQLLIVAIALGVAEIVLRVIDLRYLRTYRVGADRVYNYDAELGWFPVPNSDVTFTGIRTIKVRHNSLGLRDIEHDTAPKPTIAFVGDSFVWGYDAEQNERFTELLRARMPEHRIVNAGVTAYGTDQEYLTLRRLWDRIKPNVVVLMVCVDNDRKDNTVNTRNDGPYKPYYVMSQSGGEFKGMPVPWSRHLYFADNWLARNSWVVRVAVSAYVLLVNPPITVPDPTERLIGLMRQFVEAREAKFLVGLQLREPQLEAFLTAQKIPYTSFDGAEHERGDGDHWTPNGHQLVAERLFKLFSETGIETPPPPH